jgi:hypothetical protein
MQDRISPHLHSHEYLGLYELFYVEFTGKCAVLLVSNTFLDQQLHQMIER